MAVSGLEPWWAMRISRSARVLVTGCRGRGGAQHLGVLLGQRLVEVLGVGPGDAPALPVEAGGVLGSSPVVWVRMVR